MQDIEKWNKITIGRWFKQWLLYFELKRYIQWISYNDIYKYRLANWITDRQKDKLCKMYHNH